MKGKAMLQAVISLYRLQSYRFAVIGITLLMVLVMIGLHGAGVSDILAFQREAIAQGQWWRLYSGHLVHFTTYHLLMNCAGAMVISYMFLWRLPLGLLLLHWLLVPVLVGLCLYVFSADLSEYRGFSGVFYSLLMTGLMVSRHADALLSWMGIVLLLGKTVYEQLPMFDDHYLLEEIGAPVAVDAHLYGVLTAVCMLFGVWVWQKSKIKYAHE